MMQTKPEKREKKTENRYDFGASIRTVGLGLVGYLQLRKQETKITRNGKKPSGGNNTGWITVFG